MADLNFPLNPQVGDTYSIGNRTWVWNGSGWALQSGIISTNPFIVVSAQVTTTTNSTSTTSGALIVAGGAGFGGDIYSRNIYGANIYSNGNQVITTATLAGYGVSELFAGTDTAVSANIGSIVVWNTSTLQSVTNRGAITTNAVSIKNTTTATSTNTGALTVVGGVGIGEKLVTGGDATIGFSKTNWIEVKGAASGATSIVGTGTDFNVNIDIVTKGNGKTTVQSTLASATTSNNALYVMGGVGIDKTLYASEIYDNSKRVLTSVSPVAGAGISITAVSTSGPNTTFTINGIGVNTLSGTTYIGVSTASGAVSITNLGVQTLTAGTDTAVSGSTGTITVWNTSTLQSVTNRGSVTNNAISITNASGSISTASGALQVAGGAGIGQNLYVGGLLNVKGPATFSDQVVFNGTATFIYSTNTYYTDNLIELHTTSTGVTTEWTFDDGQDIGLRFHYFNRTLATGTNAALVLSADEQYLEWFSSGAETGGVFTGTAVHGTFKTANVILNGTATNNNNSTTGALQVAGGVGIGSDLWVGGISGTASSTAVNQQAFIVNANGLGVNGDSYINGKVGISGNIVGGANISIAGISTVTGASYLNGAVTANSSLGVAGNFNVTGTTFLSGAATANSTLGVRGDFNVTGTTVLAGLTTVTNLTQSAGTNSGAFQVLGGVGIGGNLNVGGNIFVAGQINATVVGTISTASNLAGGAAGSIPYQTGFGLTSFFGPGTAGDILISTGGAQPKFVNTLTLAGTNVSTDYNTGALVVKGGVGIWGNLNVANTSYVASAQIITTATLNRFITQTNIIASTGTAVNTATGNVTVWSTASLQTVTDFGTTTTNRIVSSNATNSTSTTTGAIQTAGGVGVQKDVWIGGDLNVYGKVYLRGAGVTTLDGNTGTFNYVFINGTGTGLTVANNVTVGGIVTATSFVATGGISTVSGVLRVTNTIESTSTTTGALVVSGGTGIGGNLNVAGTATVAGSLEVGPVSQMNSDISAVVSTTATIALDTFAATAYRTAKYLVQAVDTGFTPNKVHVAELVVFHDNNGASTIPYLVTYGIGNNAGVLGTWDVVYSGGNIVLQFTPNYTPTALTVKSVRTSITT